MNKIVEDQLKKVKICKLPEYDESTLELHIPKQSSNIQCSVEENHCYILQLERYIIDPPPNFTLHSNWNKGIPPKHEIVKAEISKIMGKMIKINSVGYDMKNNIDTNDLWEGWVPLKGIKVLKEI